MENNLKTGTTTVGLLYKDGVVLAADKRATAGNLIVGKNMRKVIKILDNLAITTAGSVSEIQLAEKYMKAELSLKEMRTGRKTSVKEAASFLAGMNYNTIRRYFGIAHFIVAGYDHEGAQLYDVFPDGSLTKFETPEGYVCSGSGSVFAYGILENECKENLDESSAVKIAEKAVQVALQRDSASGNGVTIFVINKDGVKEVVDKLYSYTN